jgi:hypothetical protein
MAFTVNNGSGLVQEKSSKVSTAIYRIIVDVLVKE